MSARDAKSRLMEACGLKFSNAPAALQAMGVTPYGGVWIEILVVVLCYLKKGHALWRRVD